MSVVKSRRQLEMEEALQGLGSEVLERVEEVSIDLGQPYKNLVEELLDNFRLRSLLCWHFDVNYP